MSNKSNKENKLIKFDSKFEQQVFESAKWALSRIPSRQSPAIYRVDLVITKTMNPDFTLGKFYIETKGWNRKVSEWLLILDALCECDPEFRNRYRVVLENNFRVPGKKQYISDALNKLGITYHIGREIPQAWISEAFDTSDAVNKDKDKDGGSEEL